jgi:hypothetical protein
MANYGRQMGSLIAARMPAAQDNACRCTVGADRRWPGSALLTVVVTRPISPPTHPNDNDQRDERYIDQKLLFGVHSPAQNVETLKSVTKKLLPNRE